MIVGMKKIFVVVQEKDILPALENLRQLGLLHIEHVDEPVDTSVHELEDKLELIGRVIDVLGQEKHMPPQIKAKDPEQVAIGVNDLTGMRARLEDEFNKRQGEINAWEPWGDFKPEDIRRLRERGIFIELAEIPKKELKSIPADVTVQIIDSKKDPVRCVLVSRREKQEYPFSVLPMPAAGLKDLMNQQEETRREIHQCTEKIKASAQYVDSLRQAREELIREINFRSVYAGRGRAQHFAFLKGYCPEDRIERLSGAARKESWGILIEDPAEDDPVPTLLRSPQWVEIVQPLFSWLNIVPGYREMDISIIFLFFFSLFFGILIGDAGYGLVFLGVTAAVHLKLKKKNADLRAIFLMYVLSFCTIAWGALSGTFFGQAWLSGMEPWPVQAWLRDNRNFQWLCFLIGSVQLSIAHIWRGIRRMPSISVISEIGWLLVLWGMFFVANLLILGKDFPEAAKGLFIIGPMLVVFFAHPSSNIFKTLGLGVGELLNNIVNTFTDIVSYIRLFAVGLATIAVADAFNEAAVGIGFSNVLTGLITALILVVGHVFNMALCAMSILVHGLRLNVLEFSSHLNLEWKGFPYNPFRKTKESEV